MSTALEAAQHGAEVLLGLGTTLVVVTGIFVTVRVFWDAKSTGKPNADDCETSEPKPEERTLADTLANVKTSLSPPFYS